MVLFGSSSIERASTFEAVARGRRLAGDRRGALLLRRRAARPRRSSRPGRAPPRAGSGRASRCTAPATGRASRRASLRLDAFRPAPSRFCCTRSSTSPQILQRRREQQVERAADRAVGGILHRHHGELRRARLARCGTPRRSWRRAPPATAPPKCLRTACSLNVPSRPEVGDAQRPPRAPRQAEMISRNTRVAASAGSGSPACARDAAQDLGLALRPVGGRAALQRADALRQRARGARSSASSSVVEPRRSRRRSLLDVVRSCLDGKIAHREHAVDAAQLARAPPPAPGCPRRPACRPSRRATCSACCGC